MATKENSRYSCNMDRKKNLNGCVLNLAVLGSFIICDAHHAQILPRTNPKYFVIYTAVFLIERLNLLFYKKKFSLYSLANFLL